MSKRVFGREVAIQALGTVIGGLVLVPIVKMFGLLDEVPWDAVGRVALVVLGIIVAVLLYTLKTWLENRLFDRAGRATQTLEEAITESVVWERLSPRQKEELERVVRLTLRGLMPL